MTVAQLETALTLVLAQITFINESLIEASIWSAAELLCRDIDPADVDFIALNEQLSAVLWTGDKILYNGLRNKKYTQVLTTDELWTLRARLMP